MTDALPFALKEAPSESDRDTAAFSYLPFMSIPVSLFRRDSAFIRFHYRQSHLLLALAIICWFIPYAGRILELVLLAGIIDGFVVAARGEWSRVPVIGFLSEGKIKDAGHDLRSLLSRLLHRISAKSRNVAREPLLNEKKELQSASASSPALAADSSTPMLSGDSSSPHP